MFRRKPSLDAITLQAANAICAKVMVTDENFNIVCINDAVMGMMRDAEVGRRRDLANFKADTLIGSNIDVFHKKPAHQRRTLKGAPHRGTLNPIRSPVIYGQGCGINQSFRTFG